MRFSIRAYCFTLVTLLITSFQPALGITKAECGKALYSKDVVRFVQYKIKSFGIDPGPVDGVYGKLTKRGINLYRRLSDLAPVGTIAMDLINSLAGEKNPKSIEAIHPIHKCFENIEEDTSITEKIEFSVPTAFGTHLPGMGTTIVRVKNSVELISNGGIEMTIHEPNELMPPFEILDSVSVGNVNAGYTIAGYWADKISAAPLFSSVPFGPEAGEFLAWMWMGNGRTLYQEMYDMYGYDVHVIPCGIIAPETSGWFRKEIKTVDDLNGLNMRFFGLGAKVMQKLGVNTSLLPGGEIFDALKSNAIDAAEFSMPAIDSRLGFYKVAKYNYFPGWHQQATLFELLINKKTWNNLSKQQKGVLEISCKAATADSLAEGEALQFTDMIKNRDKNGVKIMLWSQEMLSTFRTTWEDVAKEESRNDAFFAKVYTDQKKFRDDYKIWKTNAFLPRN